MKYNIHNTKYHEVGADHFVILDDEGVILASIVFHDGEVAIYQSGYMEQVDAMVLLIQLLSREIERMELER